MLGVGASVPGGPRQVAAGEPPLRGALPRGDGASPETRSQPSLLRRPRQNQGDRPGLWGGRAETRTPCWLWGLGQGCVTARSGAQPAAEADTQKVLPGIGMSARRSFSSGSI